VEYYAIRVSYSLVFPRQNIIRESLPGKESVTSIPNRNKGLLQPALNRPGTCATFRAFL
jgi:hypothetical protein